MADFNNNKFVPNAPETFQVLELRDQQQQPVKKSPLSPAARSKIINRSGSNYLSENKGYGPCFKGNCNFSITATLVDRNGNSRNETRRPTSYGEVYDMARDVNFGLGEWEDNISFFPSTKSRVALAAEINSVTYCHGPQRITVEEDSTQRSVTVNINGFKRRQ